MALGRTLLLACLLSAGALTALPRADASPFSDVPGSHWAEQAIEQLAADGLVDGYPDGTFRGDRALTRYEMAAVVARVLAKLQAEGASAASKSDLETLQKLVDALKDELDALGVRTASLEDALAALDRRTSLAQRLSLHGSLFTDTASTQQPVEPRDLSGAPADPYVRAFLTTPPDDDPLEQQLPGQLTRFDDRVTLSYAASDELTVSLPIHVVNYDFGGTFSPQGQYALEPALDVDVARAGNVSAARLEAGAIDDLPSSRLGLAYQAPQDEPVGPGLDLPLQPYERGFSLRGTVNGFTDVELSFAREDPLFLNTELALAQNADGLPALDGYLFPRVPPAVTTLQSGSQPTTYTYVVPSGGGSAAFLPSAAVPGTVAVVAVDGVACNVPGAAACPVSFTYAQQTNQVVFGGGLAPGSTITMQYDGLGVGATAFDRYHVGARVDQRLAGLPGGEIGVTFSRVFDVDDAAGIGDIEGTAPVTGYGAVSDSVFGLDFALPLPFVAFAGTPAPVSIVGEAAASRWTPDAATIAPTGAQAGVVGLRLRVRDMAASLRFQSVGAHFMSGAPFAYEGPPPSTFAQWEQPYFPQFFGFANNLAINRAFDAATGTATAGSPATTFIFPVYNPFVAGGPDYTSAFAPNTQGLSFDFAAPVRVGGASFTAGLGFQHLQELEAGGFGPLTYTAVSGVDGSPYPSDGTKLRFDKLHGSVSFALPILRRVAVNLTGDVEHLVRHDVTASAYVPSAPAAGSSPAVGLPYAQLVPDPAAAAAAGAAGPVLFYPNYVDMVHTTLGAGASIPVAHGLTVGVGYDTQGYYGSYGTTIAPSIAERKDAYSGSLTYTIPKTNSSISALVSNEQYRDNVLPSYNFSGTREDLSLTVRF